MTHKLRVVVMSPYISKHMRQPIPNMSKSYFLENIISQCPCCAISIHRAYIRASKVACKKPTLYCCGNQVAVNIAHNQVQHG